MVNMSGSPKRHAHSNVRTPTPPLATTNLSVVQVLQGKLATPKAMTVASYRLMETPLDKTVETRSKVDIRKDLDEMLQQLSGSDEAQFLLNKSNVCAMSIIL